MGVGGQEERQDPGSSCAAEWGILRGARGLRPSDTESGLGARPGARMVLSIQPTCIITLPCSSIGFLFFS